ncbi:MAG TPA: glycosyltransferase [Phycisphaerae bacterium]|nr:glycosyltransferase [Phycisphaerales bacterium]HRX87632.1 glycosyltransferase [Phycisphaerae bacterium]
MRAASDLRWPEAVLCFGGEDWWYHNRGHCDIQFMRQFAAHGRVLYMNSIVMRKFNVGEGAMFWTRVRRKLKSITRGLVRVSPTFNVYSPVTAPVHHLPGARGLNRFALTQQVRLTLWRLRMRRPLIWVNIPAGCDTALTLPRSGLVYQRTDRYEDHPGVDVEQILRYDRTLKEYADLTFYSNRALYEEEKEQCRRAAYVEHGVEYERFVEAADRPRTPGDLRDLPRPIVGFFGALDEHKFNITLAAAVAERLSDLTFVFVGQPTIDTAPLERLPNVHLLGQRPYEDIPHYGAAFDVCILPFNQNRWIAAMNPIKLKEYLALGKPVVATPFGELSAYANVVRIADGAEAFAAAVRAALADTAPDRIAARRARVAAHSWRSKAEDILSILGEVKSW